MGIRLFIVACLPPLSVSLHGQVCVPPVNFTRTAKAPLRDVVFHNDAVLTSDKEEEVVAWAREQTVDPHSLKKSMSSIAEEAAERVRWSYQDQGYFKAEVDARAAPVTADGSQYDIVVQLHTVGKQYRLGDLNIVRATSFPAQQLRDLFPIQRGEIFSREKIAGGLEELRRLYNSQGYINYTGVPETEFDDEHAVANLIINADEGRQFRLRSVEVLGLDPETETRVLQDLALKPGDIYNADLWEKSLLRFQNIVQDSTPRSVNQPLDEANGAIDIVLDFRKTIVCPPAEHV